uniref:Probable pectate lyase F n=1 Tax=Meloidogyne hapla TaxID=6305 RepID=A0A1I8BMJ4_MELHA
MRYKLNDKMSTIARAIITEFFCAQLEILQNTLVITKNFDCKFTRYVPDPKKIGDGGANEYQKPVIEVRNGAILSNCIIGALKGYKAADGVHCEGSCTLKNVWHEKVGEDAVTFLGTFCFDHFSIKKETEKNFNYIIEGGGAQNSNGKVIQFNGAGTAKINNFYIKDCTYGIASCGNCAQQFTRRIEVTNLKVENLKAGQFIVAVNSDFNDIAILKNIHIIGKSAKKVFPCKIFNGVKGNGNFKLIKMGADEKHCKYNKNDIKYN